MLPFGDLKATTKLTWKSASKRRPGTEAKDKVPSRKGKAPEDVPGLINGQPAGSAYEWNVARALWTLGWTFTYQLPVLGGKKVHGGQVLDFLVHTVPLETAVIVNGNYWHQTDEDFKNNELMSALIRYGYAVNRQPIIMKMAQAGTYEAAYAFLNSKIGKG